MGESTTSSNMKVFIFLCLLIKLVCVRGMSKDKEEVHGTGLLEPLEEERVDEKSEQYFDQFRFTRSSVPNSYSSVEKGFVSPVKNQYNCGSCVAFASTAAIETCFKKKVGVFGDYSEQQLVDCGYKQHGANGCAGAAPHAYIQWADENKIRLAHESQYPYKNNETDYTCPSLPVCNQGVRISGSFYTYSGDEDLLKRMVYEHGAVVASVYGNGTFKSYGGGIFEGCPAGSSTDHSITVVGYGTEGGVPFWLIKNSWGTNWGENGFIRMKRGVGMCGIGRALAVVHCETVTGTTDPPMTTAIPCIDKYTNCKDMAETHCYTEHIAQGCRKACGLCPGMTPASSYTCYDKYTDCKDMAETSCYKEFMAQDCRKACGLCPGMTPASSHTCYDKYSNCASLCNTQHKNVCKKSCGLCN